MVRPGAAIPHGQSRVVFLNLSPTQKVMVVEEEDQVEREGA